MNRACWLALGLGAALVLQAGCGASEAKLRNDLKATGLAFHLYHDEHKQGPKNWDEFIAFAKSSNAGPESLQRVRDAGYDLKWGVKLSDAIDGTSNAVLAEKPGGGPKIMMDGGVR